MLLAPLLNIAHKDYRTFSPPSLPGLKSHCYLSGGFLLYYCIKYSNLYGMFMY